MSLFLRHSGERVIRRSQLPSPMLTVSLTDSSVRNNDAKGPARSLGRDNGQFNKTLAFLRAL